MIISLPKSTSNILMIVLLPSLALLVHAMARYLPLLENWRRRAPYFSVSILYSNLLGRMLSKFSNFSQYLVFPWS